MQSALRNKLVQTGQKQTKRQSIPSVYETSIRQFLLFKQISLNKLKLNHIPQSTICQSCVHRFSFVSRSRGPRCSSTYICLQRRYPYLKHLFMVYQPFSSFWNSMKCMRWTFLPILCAQESEQKEQNNIVDPTVEESQAETFKHKLKIEHIVTDEEVLKMINDEDPVERVKDLLFTEPDTCPTNDPVYLDFQALPVYAAFIGMVLGTRRGIITGLNILKHSTETIRKKHFYRAQRQASGTIAFHSLKYIGFEAIRAWIAGYIFVYALSGIEVYRNKSSEWHFGIAGGVAGIFYAGLRNGFRGMFAVGLYFFMASYSLSTIVLDKYGYVEDRRKMVVLSYLMRKKYLEDMRSKATQALEGHTPVVATHQITQESSSSQEHGSKVVAKP